MNKEKKEENYQSDQEKRILNHGSIVMLCFIQNDKEDIT